MELYSERIEALIKAALADGKLTDKERQVLMRKAAEEGIDPDEFEMVLDAKVTELESSKNKGKKSQTESLRKCPACGALIPALAVACPDCGYEFSGASASSSSQQLLAEQIAEATNVAAQKKNEIISSGKFSTKKERGQIWTEQERVIRDLDRATRKQIDTLVDSFPIPNAKDDLFDLIMFLKTQGYNHKYEECLKRAGMLFPNDPLFSKLQAKAKEDEEAQAKRKEKLHRELWGPDYTIPFYVLLVICIILVVILICIW